MKKLKINGTIIPNEYKKVYDHFGIDATCPNDVLEALGDDQDVTIQINSGGGLVNAGQEIYHELTQRIGKVTIEVVWAGSAASLIAMAGDVVKMSPVGQMMIHNAAMVAEGDYQDMDHASYVLESTNKAIASAYQIKTGLDTNELLDLMNTETWLTADEALEKGFADEIMMTRKPALEMVANVNAEIIPKKVINEFREQQTKVEAKSPFERFVF